MKIKLKCCPWRVYGERRNSCLVAGEYTYVEEFMPCYGEECPAYDYNGEEAWCRKDGGNLTLWKKDAEH